MSRPWPPSYDRDGRRLPASSSSSERYGRRYEQHDERRSGRGHGLERERGERKRSYEQFARRRGMEENDSSRSPSPDPEVTQFLAQQARPVSPSSEAYRKQRIAAAGVSHVKSRHQREKEEAERKQKEAEEDAARAYKAFVEDMQGDAKKTNDKGDRQGAFVKAGGSLYEPSAFRRRTSIDDPTLRTEDLAIRQKTGSSSMLESQRDGGEGEDQDETQGGYERARTADRDASGKRKAGAMQDFLGEIQRNQAKREERKKFRLANETPSEAQEDPQASFSSSNVCILNIPANISEQGMAHHFSVFGDIASVKIMWPRAEEASFVLLDGVGPSVRVTRHEGATGFVHFMKQEDARKAFYQADKSLWQGSSLRTRWGKNLPKPELPFVRQHLPASSSLQMDAASQPPILLSSTPQHKRHRKRTRRSEVLLSERVRAVKGEEMEKLVRWTALRIRDEGHTFERLLREREFNNEKFAFLHSSDSIEHQLYLSIVSDDHIAVVEPPSFTDEGETILCSDHSDEDSEQESLRKQGRANALGLCAFHRLDVMLKRLTLRRERIANVMMFALEHAISAESVTDRLVASLLLPLTPLPRKLARLYAVSDILHNASAPTNGAWRYRSLLEFKLDDVFLHWGDVANSFAGRIKSEACKDMARAVLSVWDVWLVFDSARLKRWRAFVEAGSAVGEPSEQLAEFDEQMIDDIDGETMESKGGDRVPDSKPKVTQKYEEDGDDDEEEKEDIDGEVMA